VGNGDPGCEHQAGVISRPERIFHKFRSAYDRPIEIEGANVTIFSRRRFLHLAAGAAALPAASQLARAQTYPSRPITMVVPVPAGGPGDTIGRSFAERMGAFLGQPLIIENVGGANGSIGVGRVARAAPDGYTLSLGFWNTHVANGALYVLQYDVLTDFEPVALLVSYSPMILAKKTIPANDLKELIAWLKADPDKALQGSSGVGSLGHLSGVHFQNTIGTRFQHVPYRGAAPAMQDLVAGHIDFLLSDGGTSLPYVRSGQIKAFAYAAKTRLALAPDIPTADEAGLPGFYVSQWTGLWVPKGTPKDIIGKLNAAVVSAFADPTMRQKLADQGFEMPARDQQTPEALVAFHKAEIAKWWPIIKAANIKGE
jgi:tripartite-type tricarboxylate transporter receptor subunit TctC